MMKHFPLNAAPLDVLMDEAVKKHWTGETARVSLETVYKPFFLDAVVYMGPNGRQGRSVTNPIEVLLKGRRAGFIVIDGERLSFYATNEDGEALNHTLPTILDAVLGEDAISPETDALINAWYAAAAAVSNEFINKIFPGLRDPK